MRSPCYYIGHNVKFDAKALVRACRKVDLVEKLKTAVVGFSDTVPIFKTILPNNSGYTQESVVAAVLGKSYDAHNSLADATTLRDVVVHCEIPQNLMLKQFYNPVGRTICDIFARTKF